MPVRMLIRAAMVPVLFLCLMAEHRSETRKAQRLRKKRQAKAYKFVYKHVARAARTMCDLMSVLAGSRGRLQNANSSRLVSETSFGLEMRLFLVKARLGLRGKRTGYAPDT